MGIPAVESERGNADSIDKYATPQHPVSIRRAFYLSETPVTRGEYRTCVDANACERSQEPSFAQTDNDPVVNISYKDAKAYADWLSAASGGKDYRLPTEAEWEYAARAGTSTARYWGDDFDDAHPPTVPLRRHGTMPVKTFPPNGFGLYDTQGQVWQWVEDCYISGYDGGLPADERSRTTDGCDRKVLRGGSWDSGPWYVSAGVRFGFASRFRSTDTGFRVARTL